MVKQDELTDSQRRALDKMPDKGWFTHDDVILITRPGHNLRVLTNKGYLERKFIFSNDILIQGGHFMYKKIRRGSKC